MRALGPRRGRWGGALALAAALALLAPGQAAAGVSPDTYVVPGGSLVYATMSGAHGYRIHFSEWEGRRQRRFKVVVKGHHATMTYALPAGRAPAEGIAANLGRRGRFDLRLRRLGKVRRLMVGPGCEGGTGTWRRGFAAGLARFRGERDYTDARARSVPVLIESWSAFRCHYAEGGEPRGTPRRAHVSAHQGRLSFGAVLFTRHSTPPDERAQFRATMYVGGSRMQISRELQVRATESTFAFPGGPKLPEDVAVEPPKPFAGSAEFIRTAESTFAWSGDLTVQFPGLDPIRLAGPSFVSGVCAIEGCVRQEPEREPPG